MYKKKVTLKVLDNVACKYPDPKIYIEENLTEKVRSFILSDALPWWSTFSCISSFVLESRQIEYLDTYDLHINKSGFTILVDLNTNYLEIWFKALFPLML